MNAADIGARIEIEELLARYCHSFDDRDWPSLRALFTPDAALDFSELEGPVGNVDDAIAFFMVAFPSDLRTQHVISTTVLDISGERASGRTMCRALSCNDVSGALIAMSYEDAFILTKAGWRIGRRTGRKMGLFAMAPLGATALGND